MNIGFIGTGNMGGALIRGYAGTNAGDTVHIFDTNPEQIKKFNDLNGIASEASLDDLVNKSNIIVLAVKPDIFEIVLPQIRKLLDDPAAPKDKVFVSIAAGISISYMKKMIGDNIKIIRTMPNLNSMVGQGMTAVCKDSLVDGDEFEAVMNIFDTVGKTAEVGEDMIDTVIGVSGSSPAYAFMYMDALIKCAVKNGMTYSDALTFAAQATLGAAVTVMESGIDPETLTKNVCSPGGTTIEAVNKLDELDFQNIIEEAMTAAIEKSKRITK